MAWRDLNQFMFNAALLDGYRLGNRHVVPRLTLEIQRWKRLIPLEAFGYRPTWRLNRLKRNYLNEESLVKCRAYMDKRSPNKPSTHGIVFGTGRKSTPPCMVAGSFFWNPGRLQCNFYLRASEVTKTLGADFHFLNYIIRNAVPPWMLAPGPPSVHLHLAMAYSLSQFFPVFDMICPGYPLNEEHKFHRDCLKAIRKAQDEDTESKWKPERRMQKRYRVLFREGKFKTDRQGRIIHGPSFFPIKKKHMS